MMDLEQEKGGVIKKAEKEAEVQGKVPLKEGRVVGVEGKTLWPA